MNGKDFKDNCKLSCIPGNMQLTKHKNKLVVSDSNDECFFKFNIYENNDIEIDYNDNVKEFKINTNFLNLSNLQIKEYS